MIVFSFGGFTLGDLYLKGCKFWSRMNGGKWSPASRQIYNLRDGVSRYTVQVWVLCFLLKQMLNSHDV
jgi:hypothetical protein